MSKGIHEQSPFVFTSKKAASEAPYWGKHEAADVVNIHMSIRAQSYVRVLLCVALAFPF